MKKELKRYISIGALFAVSLAICYIAFFMEQFDIALLLEVVLAGLLFAAWYYYDEKKK